MTNVYFITYWKIVKLFPYTPRAQTGHTGIAPFILNLHHRFREWCGIDHPSPSSAKVEYGYSYTSTSLLYLPDMLQDSLYCYLDWGEWSALRPDRFTSGVVPGTHSVGGWLSPTAGLVVLEKSKSFTATGTQTPDQRYNSLVTILMRYPSWSYRNFSKWHPPRSMQNSQLCDAVLQIYWHNSVLAFPFRRQMGVGVA